MKAKVTPLRNEEEKYQLTPKGCAVLALADSGMIENIDDNEIEDFWTTFEEFWTIFEKNMRKAGYVIE